MPLLMGYGLNVAVKKQHENFCRNKQSINSDVGRLKFKGVWLKMKWGNINFIVKSESAGCVRLRARTTKCLGILLKC